MNFRAVCVTLFIGAAAPAFAQHASPYAGQERSEIKSLSPQEVTSLLAGHGMGYARAAELNGYPGPMHVIELADRLALTPQQRKASERLMAEHRANARDLGAQVIAAERALDQLFAERSANAQTVSAAAERAGQLQAQLRAKHLNTHLAQTQLLNAEQIRRYNELRGYAASTNLHPRPHRN